MSIRHPTFFGVLALLPALVNCNNARGTCVGGQCSGKGECAVQWDNAKYVGQCVGGHAEGVGEMEWNDKSVYKGEFKDGEPNGFGKKWWKNGNLYEGSWKDGFRNGKGKITYGGGGSYEGDWVNGDHVGEGVVIQKDGRKGVGHFDKDVLNGPCTWYAPDGSIEFQGTCKDGKPVK